LASFSGVVGSGSRAFQKAVMNISRSRSLASWRKTAFSFGEMM
jgi:hypothetical protein